MCRVRDPNPAAAVSIRRTPRGLWRESAEKGGIGKPQSMALVLREPLDLDALDLAEGAEEPGTAPPASITPCLAPDSTLRSVRNPHHGRVDFLRSNLN